MSYSKEDLQIEFNLAPDDVTQTLRACGLSVKKRTYSDRERERFATARKLFQEGAATSYDDIATYFQKEGVAVDIEDSQTNRQEPMVDARLTAMLETLRQEAIAQGFEIGLQQAEMMKQVIPHATILRLQQMIQSGELRTQFESVWRQMQTQLGEPQSLMEEVEAHWQTIQLPSSPPPASLPESSMESSGSDSF